MTHYPPSLCPHGLLHGECEVCNPAPDERQAGHRPQWLDDVPTGWCECGKPYPHEADERQADECPSSQRVDGKKHSWKFDGDSPIVVCHWCGARRDALTGEPLRDRAALAVAQVPAQERDGVADAIDSLYEVPAQEERLDVERLAEALRRYGGEGRARLVLPVSRLSEVARAVAAEYRALGVEAGPKREPDRP